MPSNEERRAAHCRSAGPVAIVAVLALCALPDLAAAPIPTKPVTLRLDTGALNLPAASISLADPAFGGAEAALQALGGAYSQHVAKSASWNVLPTDNGKIFEVTTGNANVTATLPSAAAAGNGFVCVLRKADYGTGIVINSATVGTADSTGHEIELRSDGTNWTQRFIGGTTDGSGNYVYTSAGSVDFQLGPGGTFRINGVNASGYEPVGTTANTVAAGNDPRLPTIAVSGADPTGAADCTSAIQTALNAVPTTGARIYLPAGKYKVSGSLTIANPTLFVGDGDGGAANVGGPGSEQNQGFVYGGTTLLFSTATGTGITVNASACSFQDIALYNAPTSVPTAGAGILLNYSTGTHFSRVIVDGFYVNVHFISGYLWTMTDCGIYDSAYAGVYVEDQATHDGGDQSIVGCAFGNFVQPTYATLAHVLIKSGGGLKIVNSKFNGTPTSHIKLAIGVGITTSDLLICNNSFENQTGYAIDLGQDTGSTGTWPNVVITGNQFAACNYGIRLGPGVTSSTVGGNHIAVSDFAIFISGGANHKILPNTLQGVNASIAIANTSGTPNISGCEIFQQAYMSTAAGAINIGDTTGGTFGTVHRQDERALPAIGTTAATLVSTQVPAYAGGNVRIVVQGIMQNVGGFCVRGEWTFERDSGALSFTQVGTTTAVGAGASHLTLTAVDASNGGNMQVRLTSDSNTNTCTGTSSVLVEGASGAYGR